MTYIEFLQSKIPQAEQSGFEAPSPPHPSLFPHQSDICHWAIKGGRRAIFANFGLGKTRIHLQLAKWVTEKTEGRFLIICPLGVRQEFTLSDGPAMDTKPVFCRTTAEILATDSDSIIITNYESVRDGKIDVGLFAGVGMDEASVLRSYGSKTYQTFLPKFKHVPYRFVFTATPSPNRYKELIHYGGFLGVMDTGEALTRFFQRDSEQAGNLTLYPHMERQFWLWLSSWSAFIQRPSDLGYSDEGYDLPEIKVHWHRLESDHTKAWETTDSWGQRQMFLDQAVGLKESAETKRDSIASRVKKAQEIVSNQSESRHWLIWHDLEDERKAIERQFTEAKTVYGSQDLDARENLIMGFSRGEYRILATKPIIAGSGCNFQRHCSDAIFLGVGYKFNDFIQAVHRIHRFQQKNEVHIHIVHMDSEDAIVAELKAKWSRHDKLQQQMTALMREYRLTNEMTLEMIRSMIDGTDAAEVRGERFRAVRSDCTLELAKWEENSVDHICTSIPFGNQYEYSPSYNDFGHNSDNDAFFEQMDYLCPELLRVLRPGRIAAIHVKDRIRFGNVTGDSFPTVDPFSDMTVASFRKAGFRFIARITIDTDVVRENNQTYRLGWSENAKDSSKMGAGMPEYVLVFRKLPSDQSNGYADVPVVKPKSDIREYYCECGHTESEISEFHDNDYVAQSDLEAEIMRWKCPNCGIDKQPECRVELVGYTRADWQLDAAGLWRSNGNRLPDPEIMRNMSMTDIKRLWTRYSVEGGYSHEDHVELAKALEAIGKLPSSFMLFPPISRNKDIWTDIARMRTLNSEQSRRNQEMHVCPLQLDIIKRVITRYTNPGEIVLDPFGGIGSVPFQAIKMGRIGHMIELNEEYWRCAVGYCEQAESEHDVPTLFDLATLGSEVVAR